LARLQSEQDAVSRAKYEADKAKSKAELLLLERRRADRASNDEGKRVQLGDDARGHLFIGSVDAAFNEAWLTASGVRAVLNVTREAANFFPDKLVYERVEIADELGEAIEVHFQPAADWIHERLAGGANVLVHCMKGKSRSAAIVVNYLMTHCGMTLDAALTTLTDARPTASINDGFMLKLQQREAALYPDIVAQRRQAQLADATADTVSAFEAEAQQKIDAQKAPKKRRSLKQIASNKKKVAELERKVQEKAASLPTVERRSSRRTKSAVSYAGLDVDVDDGGDDAHKKRASADATAPKKKRSKSLFNNKKPSLSSFFSKSAPTKTNEDVEDVEDDPNDDNDDVRDSIHDDGDVVIDDDLSGKSEEKIEHLEG
jgi:atypical dual specificity phosphatase